MILQIVDKERIGSNPGEEDVETTKFGRARVGATLPRSQAMQDRGPRRAVLEAQNAVRRAHCRQDCFQNARENHGGEEKSERTSAGVAVEELARSKNARHATQITRDLPIFVTITPLRSNDNALTSSNNYYQ